MLRLIKAVLNIHDDAGDAAGADTGAAESSDGWITTSGGKKIPDFAYRDNGGKPVKSGEQVNADNKAKPDGSVAESKTQEQLKAEFQKLVSGEYKDIYSDMFQSAFDKRFKDYKTLQERQNALDPVISTLAEKYGVADKDPAKIAKAMESDDSLIEDLAIEAGMTPQQFRENRALAMENERLRAQSAQQEQIEQARTMRDGWLRQEQEMQGIYPGFSLNDELTADTPEGKAFYNMLTKGIDVKTAYQAAHFNELAGGVAAVSAKRAVQGAAKTIAANGVRPTEAGAAAQPGAVLGDKKVSDMTGSEILARATEIKRGKYK